jgi:hypothetical protein
MEQESLQQSLEQLSLDESQINRLDHSLDKLELNCQDDIQQRQLQEIDVQLCLVRQQINSRNTTEYSYYY